MIPAELTPEVFRSYPEQSRSVVVQSLDVLRRLPSAVCPSFLLQIRNIPTNFPAETRSLCIKLDALKSMPKSNFAALVEPLRGIQLPNEMLLRDWVNAPAAFITAMTAYLWSSGQIDRFSQGTQALFAALPEPENDADRLIIVTIGQGTRSAEVNFGKLRKYGVLIRNLEDPDVPGTLLQMVTLRAATRPAPYAHWYVDGGVPWRLSSDATNVTQISYSALSPLRIHVLEHMKDTVFSGDAGTEAVQAKLSSLQPEDIQAQKIVPDRILQRFYTELFTLSSGPQIFSTSFVQWTGRELMRRAQPHTVLLRYAPRQHHRLFNEMIAQTQAETILDPDGARRDAEMGAYYAWLEARRIAPSSKLTLLVWVEGTSKLLIVAPGAPANTETNTPLTVRKAIEMFS